MRLFTGGYWRLYLDENGFASFTRERDGGDPDGNNRGVPNRWVQRASWQWSQVDRVFFSRCGGVWRLYAHPAQRVDPELPCDGWEVCHRGNFTAIRWRRVARAFHRCSAGTVAFDTSALPAVPRRLIGDVR